MANLWSIRLTGSGGQGVIKGAIILAQAALNDGLNATQSQVYGPEARGGSTKSEVNINKEEIFYPKAEKPNVLLSLTQESYHKYSQDVDANGFIIVDDIMVKCDPKEKRAAKTFSLPIVRTARDEIQNELCTNIVALGAIVGITEMLSKEAVLEGIADNFKAKIYAINEKAFLAGYRIGKEAQPLD